MADREYTEEEQRAIRDFNAAGERLKKAGGGSAGQGAEKVYGQTYNKLVQLGIMPKLKAKYRGR